MPGYHTEDHLKLSSKWFTMMKLQREQHLPKFLRASLADIQNAGDEETPISSIALGRDMSSFSILSVTLDSLSDDIRIPRNCLEGI